MANDIGPKIGIQGEAQFRDEIKAINTSLKTMGTEMDRVTSSFIGNEKSVEALTAKNEVLQKKFDELTKKADLQRAQLKKLDDAGVDPTSSSYQRLLQDLNKTETAMNKTKAEIKNNSKEMDNLGKETKETSDDVLSFGDVLKANLLSEAIVGGIKAIAAGMKKLGSAVLDAAAAADDLKTLSVQTGISTDELQKLQYAAATVDVEVTTITGAMTKLTKNMASAAGGSKAATEAFEKLGVTIQNDDGTFRDRNVVFQETIEALGKITDETERDATAMSLFGKSAQELNPLILGGAEALAELGDHAEEAGLILSGDTLDALAEVNDRFQTMKQTATLAGQQFLATFAAPITNAINTVIGYIEKLVGAFKEDGLAGLSSALTDIAADVTEKIKAFLPGFVNTAAQILSNALPVLIPVAAEAITTIVNALAQPEIINALVEGALTIINALANGMSEFLPLIVNATVMIIGAILKALWDNREAIFMAAVTLFQKLLEGAGEIMGPLVIKIGEVINAAKDAVIAKIREWVELGKNLVNAIWQGIQEAAAWLYGKVKDFFSGLINTAKDALGIASPSKVFAGIGENMALGIGVGFDRTMATVERDIMSSLPTPTIGVTAAGGGGGVAAVSGAGMVEEITIPVEVGGVELARVLYRHIVGEGQRLGAAAVG